MFFRKREPDPGDGVFLCTAAGSAEADILESKLASEGIPCGRRHEGAGGFLEIAMGFSEFPIDLYVPAAALEDARNIIVAVPLEDADTPGGSDTPAEAAPETERTAE